MSERILLEIYKDTPSQVSPYLVDTEKVAEMDVTDTPTADLDKIFKIQEVLGRRWSTRRIPCN